MMYEVCFEAIAHPIRTEADSIEEAYDIANEMDMKDVLLWDISVSDVYEVEEE